MKTIHLFKILSLSAVVFVGAAANAQYEGYDLEHIIYTEGTTNPIEDIVALSEEDLTNDTTLDIVNWNVDWLGAPKMTGNDHGTRMQHIGNVANTLVNLDADVYALQEVVVSENDGNALEDLVDSMNALTGSNTYSGVYSKFYSHSWQDYNPEFPPQCLAYVWNTKTVIVNKDSALLQNKTSTYDFGSGRLPFLLDANVAINGRNQRYMFINIHLKADKGFSSTRYKSMTLLRSLLNTNFERSNVAIIGDYNVADEGGALGEIATWGYYEDNEEDGLVDYVHACGNKRTTAGNNIEHILVSTELFDELAYVPETKRSTMVTGTKKDGYSSHHAFLGKLFVHEDTPTTTIEPVLSSSLEIFPNPSNGEFKVKNEGLSGKIQVIDLRGKVILEKSPSAYSEYTTINLVNAKNGVYFVRLQTKNKVVTQKVVVW